VSGWALHPQLRDDSHPVAMLALCEVRLMDDANYPWLILVPRIIDAVELTDLPGTEQAQLLTEIGTASRALQAQFRPHKLNIAMLGNMVRQLHVHVIARFLDDPAWPMPVWGRAAAVPYSAAAATTRCSDLLARLLP